MLNIKTILIGSLVGLLLLTALCIVVGNTWYSKGKEWERTHRPITTVTTSAATSYKQGWEDATFQANNKPAKIQYIDRMVPGKPEAPNQKPEIPVIVHYYDAHMDTITVGKNFRSFTDVTFHSETKSFDFLQTVSVKYDSTHTEHTNQINIPPGPPQVIRKTNWNVSGLAYLLGGATAYYLIDKYK